MSKSNTLELGMLKLVFQNVALTNIGDSAGLQPSGTAGNLYLALYTSDPTDADTGVEATYTSYARVPVVRSVSGWTVSAGSTDADPASARNASVVTFPTATGGDNTITHFGIKTALTGGDLLYSGDLVSSVNITSGRTPKFNANELTIKEQ